MIGDLVPGQAITFYFNTHKADGTPVSLLGTPSMLALKDGALVTSVAGLTLTVGYGGVLGLHLVAVNTAADAAFYAAGSDFEVIIAVGTVDGISVAGTVVGGFSLKHRSPLRPLTSGREVNVNALGDVQPQQYLGSIIKT